MTKETVSPFQDWVQTESWRRFRTVGLTGLKGSSKAYLLSVWREKGKGPLLIVVSSLQQADALVEDLLFFMQAGESTICLFPPWETLPYDEIPPHPEIIRERVKCLHSVMSGEDIIVVSPIQALMQKVLAPMDLKESMLSLEVGEETSREGLVRFLQENGYASARVVEARRL